MTFFEILMSLSVSLIQSPNSLIVNLQLLGCEVYIPR